MSIATELTRIINAKVAIGQAIENKNAYMIPNIIDDCALGVDSIPQETSLPAADESDVNFYDYDGRILYSYTAAEFQQLSAMPANPTYTGLTSQGWNWTLANAKAQVTSCGKCDIGQMYIPDDESTRLYCVFPDELRSITLSMCPNGSFTINWGDDTTSSISGSSLSTIVSTQHTYTNGGSYVIKIIPSTSTAKFAFPKGDSTCSKILSKSLSTSAYVRKTYCDCIKHVEIGKNVNLNVDYVFCHCDSLETIILSNSLANGSLGANFCQYAYSLKYITIPSCITQLKSYCFRYTYSLKNISIPNSVTAIINEVFNHSYKLNRVILPNSITSLGTSTGGSIFQQSYTLHTVTLPSSITLLSYHLFYDDVCLSDITIPASVTAIHDSAFYLCYTIRNYHFKRTTPPTLDNADVFNTIHPDCKIYVPSASVNAYKTANIWSDFASYIYGE